MTRELHTCDTLIIGGGPAGLMAAIFAAEKGGRTVLLEKNKKVGEKLDITGGGRCNIAHDEPAVRKLLDNYGAAAPFLFSSFSRFGLKETVDFFEKNKLPLVTQARNRMFPKTEKAPDVTKTLIRAAKAAGVVIETDKTVVTCEKQATRFLVTIKNKEIWSAKKLIIATGGVSRPETGSTGSGFVFAKQLGHTTASPTPNIVPLQTDPKDDWIPKLSGVSLSFMKISFYQGDKVAFSKLGKLLFTHFGLSGPLILNSAKEVGALLEGGPVKATIDLYPDTEFDALERRVQAAFDAHKNKEFKNVLPDIVPSGMANAVIAQHAVADVKTPVHSITKEERRALIHAMKALPLTVTDLMGLDRAVVSDGGVPLTEIDTRTFESKITPGLYLIGDMLHITRPSGGFSLQLCWTSGAIAGMNT